MFRRAALLTAVAATALLAVPLVTPPGGPSLFVASPASAATVKIDIFFSTLQPYGRWVRYADYNYVWVPTRVDRDWSPYTRGHWVYTQRYGWYFQSDEPFAAIVYHYGRWGYDRAIGWYWVPGTKWGPAWVAWRRDDTHVGWAPLPPERRGYEVGVNINIDINIIPQDHWFFVQAPRFLEPDLTRVVVRGDRDQDVYGRSKPLGPVTVQNNIVINNVINLDFIQQQTKQKVEVRNVEEVADPKQAKQSSGDKGAVKAFVAEVEQPAATAKPAEAVERQEIEKKPPPTAGTASASVAPAPNGGAAAPPAAGQPAMGQGQPPAGQAQPCIDTDPKTAGCQPAAGNAATGPADQNAKGTPPADAVTAPDAKAAAPNAVVEPPKVNPPVAPPTGNAATEPPKGNATDQPKGKAVPADDKAVGSGQPAEAACPNDADPQKPGCQQPDAAAGKAAPAPGNPQGAAQPPAAANPQGNAEPPAGKPPGNANPKGADNGDCKVDTDPQQPGCQPPKPQ
ncbi:hypothetical protein BH10PSE9_BH10PSE9_22080 [soil metagenome]